MTYELAEKWSTNQIAAFRTWQKSAPAVAPESFSTIIQVHQNFSLTDYWDGRIFTSRSSN